MGFKWGTGNSYYEFGVGLGDVLSRYYSALGAFCKDFGKNLADYHAYGFDTFTGLPASSEKYRCQSVVA